MEWSKFLKCLVVWLLFSQSLLAQIGPEDYKRAQSYTYDKLSNETVFNIYMRQYFFEDSSGLWQAHYNAEGKTYEVVWFEELVRKPLFDHQTVADQVGRLLNDTLDAKNLSFSIEGKEGPELLISYNNKKFFVNINSNKVSVDDRETTNRNNNISYSPDSSWISFSEDYNLYLKNSSTGKQVQLSTVGKENYEFGSYYGWYDLMHGENGQRPENFKVNWSPDSRYLWTNLCDLRSANKMYLLDWSVDTLFRPQLYSYYRGSPGDTSMVYETPIFYNVRTQQEIKPRLPRRTHINSYWIEWVEGQDKALIIDSERGYQKQNFYLLDLATGDLELLFSEESETRVGNKREVELFPDENKLVFTSERSGWNQLYVYDFNTKKLQPITKGEFVINEIVRIDASSNEIYFMVSAMNKKMNPYHQQLFKVDLRGKMFQLLTPEPIHHEVKFSPDGKYFTDKVSSIETPSKYVLREAESGKIIIQLGETDVSRIVTKKWTAPEPFEAIGRDGKTKIYGALWKPTHFDSSKKYPIVDNSYTGPHTQVFPKTFGEAFWDHQALAELGFIVMKVDGMGTNGRSKSFQDVSYKNMGNNLVDHVLAIRQLSQKYSWIDTTRVGIYGHSAGGYDTGHALLAFPDFYKVGVASSADHDFRMEKAWWPEMYMGWPVDSTYHAVSNITMAPNLRGKLLMVHGGMDENVNPSATFKLAEALIKANKDFDMLILPSQHHGYRGQYEKYFEKKRMNYFVEHLLGEKPIWDIE